MTRYIAFEPPSGAAPGPSGPTDGARFVRDAFAGWAILFPFFWLFRHGLIVAGVIVLALCLGLGALGRVPGFELAGSALALLLGALVALEGPSLKAARLRRRQWREAAVVEAEDEEEAAILYYAGALPAPDETPAPQTMGRPSADAARMRAPAGGGASLFDPPRRR